MWGGTAKLCALLTLLAMLLLMPTRAMAAEVTARAEYNTTTKVLRFVMDDKTPADDENTLVVYLYDPETNADWFDGKAGAFSWSSSFKAATSVIIEESFKNYALPSCYNMFYRFAELQTITGGENLNTANVKNMQYMFSNCSKLTSVDVSKFKTDKVTNMSFMFFSCNKLETLDLSSFNTGQVTNMGNMFSRCNSLKTLKGLKFNTDKVTNMNGMFSECKNLQALDVSTFNTAEVTDMNYMFQYCNSLETLDLSNFNTAKVTKMNGMFYSCENLKTLNVSNFNTAEVTDMRYMFQYCSNLETLDLSNFNTAKVTQMNSMFINCKNLKTLNVSNFNTAEVTAMGNMFQNCKNIQTLDLSSFNTAKVTGMTSMFNGCQKLEKIYVSNLFTTTAARFHDNMFKDCSSLPNYDSSTSNKTNAHYRDGGYLLTYYRTSNGEIHELSGNELKADLALDDSKYFETHAPFTAITATYSRTLSAGTTWATLCLPFEVNTEGQNFRTFSVTTVGDDYVELEELQTSITAGTPVLIKMNEGETEINITEDNRPIATAPKTADAADGHFQLTGLYTPKTFNRNTDSNCYIVKANKLMNPSKILENSTVNAVGSKAFRAYLTENAATASAARMFSIGGQTTAIDKIADTLGGSDAQYFDLQGRRLDAPQKGMNIMKRGGKTVKIMIR